MRGKQYVKKRVWYIGGKKRKYRKKYQKGGAILIRLIASAAEPFLGEIAKPIFKNFFGGRRRRKNSSCLQSSCKTSNLAKWNYIHC